MLAHAIVQQLK